METLYEAIPMELWPTEYLPDDYRGPSAGSIKDINGRQNKKAHQLVGLRETQRYFTIYNPIYPCPHFRC